MGSESDASIMGGNSPMYFKLKAAYFAARQHGGPLDHPLKGPVTLRWRS